MQPSEATLGLRPVRSKQDSEAMRSAFYRSYQLQYKERNGEKEVGIHTYFSRFMY